MKTKKSEHEETLSVPAKKTTKRLAKPVNKANKTVRQSKKKPAKQATNAIALEIDNFLVDEQTFVYQQIQKVADPIPQTAPIDLDQSQPVQLKKALDRLWQTGNFKISLSQQGSSVKPQEKTTPKGSAFTLNLKKEHDRLTGLGKFSRPAVGRKFKAEIPKVSLLNSPRITDLVFAWTKTFNRIFYLPASPSAYRGEPAKAGRLPLLAKITRPEPVHQPVGPMWFKLKNALYFALVALLFIVPFRGYFIYRQLNNAQVRVLGATETAIGGLKQGFNDVSGNNWEQAGNSFALANSYFGQAEEVVGSYNQSILNFLEHVPVASQKVSGGKNLLAAGELLSQAAWEISQTMSLLKQEANNDQATDNFLAVKSGLSKALDLMRQAVGALNKVDHGLLPAEYQNSFLQLKERLPLFLKSFNEATQLLDFSEEILGYQAPKRYLFVFQNHNELRGTGGFMGSYALVDLNRGKISNLEVPGGGFYDLKQSFQASGEKILSPQPMHLLGTPLMPWDTNWWFDVPASMNKLLWFYYKSGGPTVDGVFLINASVLPQILKDTGNVELLEYNEVFTPENVVLALQHKAEFEYDKDENKPKKVIGDLMKVLVERLTSVSGEQLLPVVLTFHQALETKEIQLFFNDEKLQQQAAARNWTGQIKPAEKDYLAVISSNIGGGKSNSVIDQKIDHYAKVGADGSITDIVSLTLTHRGDPADVFERVQNNNYVRVYLPWGSKILEATGYDVLDKSLFKEVYEGYSEDEDLAKATKNARSFGDDGGVQVYDELGKTVFGAWLQIKPGETKTLSFSYLLPFKLDFKPTLAKKVLSAFGFKSAEASDDYSLLVQKQSGAINTVFNSQVSFPAGFNVAWSQASNDKKVDLSEQRAGFQTDLDKDYLYSILLKK
ncbi:MAG: DUF4012 domain-containing protein [Candidatus Komeilibacteria bacterium]|nr:DUF4012 domain-containing protein [Candidatus Komeilibacteria bacterium]